MRKALSLILALISLSGATAQTQSAGSADTKLILVPVVVRNREGLVVSNLGKEDFQLFDNGKRQDIASISVENVGDQAAPGVQIPERSTVYLFDDATIEEPLDIKSIRDAATQKIRALPPGDRVAIYTSSCRMMQDFTNERSKLQAAIALLQPRPFTACASHWETSQVELLNTIVRAMSQLPTRREIVLVSSGFFVGNRTSKAEMDLIEAAIRFKIVINSVLLGNRNPGSALVLRELSHGTGGTCEEPKDFAASFRTLATPENHYVLGFIAAAKSDGRFHQLKVKLEKSAGLKVEARTGYYAP